MLHASHGVIRALGDAPCNPSVSIMTQTKRFISEFCRWAGERGLPKNRRARLSAALQKVIEQKLPERDDHYEVIVRPLVDSEGLTCTFDSSDVWGLSRILCK